MSFSIILTTILSIFATTTPNLCDEVYVDAAGSPYTDTIGQTLPKYCVWTGPDAPVWDADVCCTIDGDGAACTVPGVEGRCPVGDKLYCEYGARDAVGGVICYQPFPSMCDAGFCIAPPAVPPTNQAMGFACCGPGGVCQPLSDELMGLCEENGGTFLPCDNGVENVDGTVDCWD